jgi:Cu(I)/Ag(I) efflux system membrane fusion protein
MKTRTQIVLSVVIVGAAAGAVVFWPGSGEEAGAAGGMEGHDHSAMVAASESAPVRMGPEEARRIGVTFARARVRPLELSIETVGTVTYDETRLSVVNPRIEGWVEELFVDFTGAPVEEGEPLMAVYSPDLVSAQEELALASRLAREAGSERSVANARRLLDSARRRLAYWNVDPEQTRTVEETGTVQRTLVLRAPAGGVVVEKNVVEGDRIAPGTNLFRIADLDRVWIEADVFEKDLGLVREGQEATAAFEAYPGQEFPARVTYVYPTVSMESRTGRVRLELSNTRRLLKPGMYARITLDAPPTDSTVVIPRSAVLSTGTRSLVFIRSEDGLLTPRKVSRGRTQGESVQILQGLRGGEEVVSSAVFLVDAESSLGILTGEMEGMSPGGEMAPGEMDHSGHEMGGSMDGAGGGGAAPDTGDTADSGHRH